MTGPSTNAWIPIPAPQHACTIWQRGRHGDGTYLRVYVPDRAADPEEPLRTVLYLHGFALCMPSFYERHLLELACAGYIVFFPDFQRSDYPDTPPLEPVPEREELPHRRLWAGTALRLARRPAEATVRPEDLHPLLAERYGATGEGIAAPPELPTVGDLRRVVFPLVLILLVLAVIGWFRRTYARNLTHLLSTVALSLASSPERWLAQAIALADAGWNDLADQPAYAHWKQTRPQAYGFGHSLGGLLTLSLPWALREAPGARFLPRVIVAADPAADSEMGIPGFAIALLRLFGAPFSRDPLRIRDTGAALTQPLAILHGAADTLVPPAQWVGRSGGQDSNFAAIASEAKALYFSCSNQALDPALIAFHNQAVTSTQYYDDALFRSFGGVKDGANAYDTTYIWPAALALFGERVRPQELLGALPEHPFAITTGEPPQTASRGRMP